MRLDQALANLLPDQSRNRLQAWVRAGRVSLDDVAVCIPKHKLKGGERLCVDVDAPEADVAHAAQDIALDVVHEDDAILVLNKPAGLVVHPGSGNWQGTLLNALLHHCEALVQVPRAGIVHRLDKDTSGLLVVAKTLTTQTHLVRQLQARSVHREYLALAHGRLTSGGRVDAPIGRHPTQRTRMAVTSGGGRDAVTHYRVQRVFEDCTLVSCRLETGRTHQIRVHMAHIGHPLVGDPVYGKRRGAKPLLAAFARQALHATRLGLIHPLSGAPMQWQVDAPADMLALLAALEAGEADDA